jgi:arginyl-tRNA synthetase
MPSISQIIASRIRRAAAEATGLQADSIDPLVRPAANPRFGDYQANLAMPLAKKLRQNPRQIAQAIINQLDVGQLCEVPRIAGPGFINLTLSATGLAGLIDQQARDDRLGIDPTDQPQRVIVDYAGANAAKEMHVGHIRSTVIGDALARVIQMLGHEVVRQNHIGDWGTQFGMLCEYLVEQGGADERSINDLDVFYRQAKKRFDSDADFADRARQRVVALQSGDSATMAIWHRLIELSMEHMQGLFDRMNITLTPQHVRGESFYNDMLGPTAEELTESGVARHSEGALCVFVPKYEAPVMIRKSDGGYGYDATDLAAIRFRIKELSADRIIYVTDARQREHFDKAFWTAREAGWAEGVSLEHAPFGAILGEDGKPFKTRSGETVKLADLLDEARQRAMAIAQQANQARPADDRLDNDELEQVARIVGIGAMKYADLCSDRIKDYLFSWQRMLAMDGNTGPYLQYACARIQSIFKRAEVEVAELTAEFSRLDTAHERALQIKLLQLPDVVSLVSHKLEPHHLCGYLYELATAFSAFYENCPVIRAEDPGLRDARLALCDLTQRVLRLGLGLLGIEVPQRM